MDLKRPSRKTSGIVSTSLDGCQHSAMPETLKPWIGTRIFILTTPTGEICKAGVVSITIGSDFAFLQNSSHLFKF